MNVPLTEVSDESSSEDGTARPAETVMQTLQDAVGRRTEVHWRHVGDVRAARGPHGGVSYACFEQS